MNPDYEELSSEPHTTEGELLEKEILVYEYKGFRTTSSLKFDAYLEKQFSELPPKKDYKKIKGVTVEKKTFKEVDSADE